MKLKAAGKTVVVIDRNPDAATAASTLGYLTVQGSISQDGVLDRVRTDTAEAFVVTIPDPDRLLAATLMARNLNPDMRIYVVTDIASPWLIHAGASAIIMSDEVVANEVIRKLDGDRSQP